MKSKFFQIVLIVVAIFIFGALKVDAFTLPANCKADYNANGTVDLADFAKFGQNYKKTGIDCSLDIVENNCYLSISDFQQFGAIYKNFNACNPNAGISFIKNYFPFGVFQDGQKWYGTQSRTTMQADLTNIRSHNISDVLFTNNTQNVDLLDSNLMNVVAAPMGTLYPNWWQNSSADVTLNGAKTIAQPIIDSFKTHPSIIGYNLADDSSAFDQDKLQLMVQAFTELDPQRPATLTQPGVDKFNYSNPQFYLSYGYPAKTTNLACDFNSKSFMGQYVNNYDQLIEIERERLDLDGRNIPHWMVLQTHGVSTATDPNATNINSLRTPTVEELRQQNWTAIAEGVRGIYWFTYTTQQFWIGLDNNTQLFNEVGTLAARVKSLSSTLLNLKNFDQQLFTASSQSNLTFPNAPLIKTLISKDGTTYYIVVVNNSCAPQNLIINSDNYSGSIKDLESGTLYNLGQPIAFNGGDGKIFKITGDPTLAQITLSPNLVVNNSFEDSPNNVPTGWPSRTSYTIDNTVAHSGTSSMKCTGPLTSSYFQVPLTAALKPNTKYSVSFWVKADQVTNQGVTLRYVHLAPSPGFTISPLGMNWVNGTTNGWKQVTREFYTLTGTTQYRFDLQYDLNAGGTSWIDDITICEGNLKCEIND